MNNKFLLKFLINLYGMQKYKLILLFLFSCFLTVYEIAFPLLLKYVIDNVTISNLYEFSMKYGWVCISFIMIQLIIKYYTLILDNQIVIHSNLVLRKEINETIKKTDYFKFINLENKNLTQIITYDVPQCQGILNSIVFDLVIQFLVFISTFCILMTLNLKLTLIIFVILPIYYGIFYIFNSKLNLINMQLIDHRDFLSNVIEKIQRNFKSYKIYVRKNGFDKQYNDRVEKISRTQSKNVKLVSVMNITMTLLFCLLIGSIAVVGLLEVKNNTLSIGALSAFLIYTMNFFSPIQKIMSLFIDFKISVISIKRVHGLLCLDLEENIHVKVEKINQGNLFLENAQIKIGDQNIINNLNGKIVRGKINYLIGRNASGKTTLILSLMQFTKSSGIYLDDHEITKYDIEMLRNNISIAFQEPEFVTDNVIDQLKLIEEYNHGKLIASEKKLIIDRYVKELVSLLEQDKPISELSGGKRQLLSIVSSLKSYPEILILDEAFSNLDSEIRYEIKNMMNSLKEHITIIVVDHFANPSLQDNIISLEQGKTFVKGEFK
ncbi:TPA: ABC transporter transmembrane domain-containing protein [Bacillus cereus]|uniref:ABC transporter family protein n=3 Tax=Bacillus TaxID=1386 RepID=A0AAN0SWJ0_BACCE|nr:MULTISPECIES: ABC transporter ATP-binding protein [Bacillus cereus group]AEW53700.1 ABC transporter, ATP-binding protein [Bacillus cereus F837/76]ABK83872.1 ABC transporter, ATP-binding and permease component [Bacillus thuringiensis str. Al Hakam]AJH68297.1 ABC transporter family protein [Bacillus thuringiensis]AJI11536.1 ABC transporter family protein [Bacillus cereus 03BB108]EDX61039.1 ABC transporter, ATP-binding and permease component [Bacillus cereus 03BB108]